MRAHRRPAVFSMDGILQAVQANVDKKNDLANCDSPSNIQHGIAELCRSSQAGGDLGENVSPRSSRSTSYAAATRGEEAFCAPLHCCTSFEDVMVSTQEREAVTATSTLQLVGGQNQPTRMPYSENGIYLYSGDNEQKRATHCMNAQPLRRPCPATVEIAALEISSRMCRGVAGALAAELEHSTRCRKTRCRETRRAKSCQSRTRVSKFLFYCFPKSSS